MVALLLLFASLSFAYVPCFQSSVPSSTLVTWNSDGSGYDVASNRAFSTSQNYGFDARRNRLRWQTKKWWFPAISPGVYNETIDNFLFDGAGNALYLFREIKDGVLKDCRRFSLFTSVTNISACLPSAFVPWIGDDTYAIGNVRVDTLVPPEQQHEFLPDTSVLTSIQNGLPFQIRVRQNGHYLLMLR